MKKCPEGVWGALGAVFGELLHYLVFNGETVGIDINGWMFHDLVFYSISIFNIRYLETIKK
jgi:hypothetical protein